MSDAVVSLCNLSLARVTSGPDMRSCGSREREPQRKIFKEIFSASCAATTVSFEKEKHGTHSFAASIQTEDHDSS